MTRNGGNSRIRRDIFVPFLVGLTVLFCLWVAGAVWNTYDSTKRHAQQRIRNVRALVETEVTEDSATLQSIASVIAEQLQTRQALRKKTDRDVLRMVAESVAYNARLHGELQLSLIRVWSPEGQVVVSYPVGDVDYNANDLPNATVQAAIQSQQSTTGMERWPTRRLGIHAVAPVHDSRRVIAFVELAAQLVAWEDELSRVTDTLVLMSVLGEASQETRREGIEADVLGPTQGWNSNVRERIDRTIDELAAAADSGYETSLYQADGLFWQASPIKDVTGEPIAQLISFVDLRDETYVTWHAIAIFAFAAVLLSALVLVILWKRLGAVQRRLDNRTRRLQGEIARREASEFRAEQECRRTNEALQETEAMAAKLKEEIRERQTAEEKLTERERELTLRVTHLTCLSKLCTELAQAGNTDRARIFNTFLATIREATLRPESVWARAVCDEIDLKSDNYDGSPHFVSCPLIVHGRPAGEVQLGTIRSVSKTTSDEILERQETFLHTATTRLAQLIDWLDAEESRAASEERLRKLTEAAQDAIVMVNEQAKITFWNPAATRMFGFSAEEALGREVHELVAPPELRGSIHARLEKFALRGCKQVARPVIELTAVKKNGQRFPVELSLATLQLGGRPSAVAIVRDLTERKKSEDLLRATERRYESLFAAINDAIIVFDESARIVDVNEAACEQYGYPRAELLEVDHRVLVAPETRDRCSLFEGHTGGKVCGECVHVRKDGTSFPVVVKATDVEIGGSRYQLTVVRDVTESKRREAQVAEQQAQLRQAQKMEAVGALAGGIAHEFNNLLQAIQGYTRFAMENVDPACEAFEDLSNSLTAVQRAAALTRQLLDFGRANTLERCPFDLNECARDVMKMLRPIIGEHIEIQLDLSDGLGTIVGDRTAVHQVIMNLCINARDAMPTNGRLTLSTKRVSLDQQAAQSVGDIKPGRYAVLSVTDTGCGMTPEVQQRIFEPFFTTKEVGKGTGLGLASVYSQAQQHNGTVTVASTPGKGTTFSVYFPVTDAPAGTRVQLRDMTVRGGTERILVAEDEKLVRHVAVRILKDAGYDVREAADGAEALRLLEEHHAELDLVVLDLVMPKVTGREVYRTMRERWPDLPVLFCTGYDRTSRKPIEEDCRDVPVLEKPFSRVGLLSAVRQVLDVDIEESDVALPAEDGHRTQETNCEACAT